MKRKVIQIANSTQLVSLPRKWALEYGIKKGDEVHVETDGNTLTISAGEVSSGPATIRVDTRGMGKKVKRIIGALYRAGYDEMIIYYDSYESLRPVQEIVRDSCIGFELIDQKKDYVVVKKVSETMNEEFEAVVKRMVMFLTTMAQETLSALASGDKAQLIYAAKMDSSMNKFMDFCGRVLAKRGTKEAWALFPAILALEQSADEYKRLCNFVTQTNTPLSKRLIDLLEEINKFVHHSYNMFAKFSAAALKKHYELEDNLQEQLIKIRAVGSKDELRVLHYLTSIVEHTIIIDSHLMTHHSMKSEINLLK